MILIIRLARSNIKTSIDLLFQRYYSLGIVLNERRTIVDQETVDYLVTEWDDVYKKGQLSLWVLLSLYDGKKYSAEIASFMYDVTNGTFEVQEQSLYRALRRFKGMDMVIVSEEESPGSGPKRKFYELTSTGRTVLARFTQLHIEPLTSPYITNLLHNIKGDIHEETN